MKIAALIVTYNRKEMLRRCIEAVLGQQCSCKPDIIVVDNNSSDGTAQMFNAYGIYNNPSIKYFNTGMNIGGAGGYAFGIRKVCELGYDYVWLMDDDCIADHYALDVFLKYDALHHGAYGFLSSKVLWKDKSICKMNVQRETLTKNVRDWDRSVIGVQMASFVSLFLPLSIVREVGLPYRQFYLWTDDWEYTRRISKRYSCFLLTDSVVTHEMEINESANIATAPENKLDRFKYLYRNDVFLYRREGIKGLSYEMMRLIYHIVKIITNRSSINEKKKRISIVINGTAQGLSFYPEPERTNVDWRI